MNNGEEENDDELEYNMDAHFNNFENENEANYDNIQEGDEGNEEEAEQDIEQFNDVNMDEDNHEQ